MFAQARPAVKREAADTDHVGACADSGRRQDRGEDETRPLPQPRSDCVGCQGVRALYVWGAYDEADPRGAADRKPLGPPGRLGACVAAPPFRLKPEQSLRG